MDKHKVVIVGNCQAKPIANLLEKMNDEIEVTKVAVVHLLKSEQEKEYQAAFEQADHIITQLVAPNYPCEFVRTDQLKNKYGDKVTTIVNLFFKGQHPDWVYIRDEQHNALLGPLYEYHNQTILRCWFAGKSCEETERLLLNVDYNFFEYENERQKSLEQLKGKEEQADIKICDFIEENEDLFWTFNHPKNLLLLEYANRIYAQFFDKKHIDIKSDKESLGKVRLPSNIINKKNKFSPDEFSVDNNKSNWTNIIERFFNLYDDNKVLVCKYISKSINRNNNTRSDLFFCFTGVNEQALSVPVSASPIEICFEVESNFLHLSNVYLEINGEWHDLRSKLIKSAKLSSVLRGDEKFSLESLKVNKSKFFSTKNEAKARLVISFEEQVCLTNIKIINRPEHSLWNRVKNIKVIGKRGERTSVLFDNNNPLNINHVIAKTFSTLEESSKLDFLKNDILLMKLYLEKDSLLGGHDFTKIILSMSDKIYFLISENVAQFDEILNDIKPLLLLIANIRSLMSFSTPVSILIAHLILGNKLKEAFNLYTFACPEWDTVEINKLKIIIDSVGKFKFGHSLVPASHSLSRPIRDWPRHLVLDTIDSILSATKIPGVKCSFICYGTLLGLYRDKDFIAHDDDIDLLCVVDGSIESVIDHVEAVKGNLIKLGLKVRTAQTNDTNELPFLLIFDQTHGIHSDLFFAYIENDKIYLPMANVRYSEIDMNKVLPLLPYNIWDKNYLVPNDIEYFLEKRYGNTWNQPDEFFRIKEK